MVIALTSTAADRLLREGIPDSRIRVIPPGDAAALAAAISRILTEPDTAARLAAAARQTAQQYTWPALGRRGLPAGDRKTAASLSRSRRDPGRNPATKRTAAPRKRTRSESEGSRWPCWNSDPSHSAATGALEAGAAP